MALVAPRLALLALIPTLVFALPARGQAEAEFFEKKIRPVLVSACLKCHGGQKVSGKLRVDSREALLKGGSSGPAVVPGKPDAGLLLKALRHKDEELKMPPDKPLPARTVADFETWIRSGATWPTTVARLQGEKHWAFESVRAVEPPADPTGWSRNPIDRFLAAKQRAKGVQPVGFADRRTFIRRVTFDLIGLPPTPEEVEQFEKDAKPQAAEELVERLLASPHYGERWGRHWLDIVRYADTAGETADFPVPHAWRYRNYVISAFNQDKPYDQFVREQLAGDVLAAKAPPERRAELIAATGYVAIARRFGFNVTADHHLTIEDTLDTLGKSILGLTIACARCHDHKYDPITQADYYALYGIFDSTRYPFPGCEHNKVPRDMVPLRAGNTELAYAVVEGKPHNVRIHKRGDPETLLEETSRRNLQMFGGQPVPASGGSGRLALAEWLTAPTNPLTARVLVNRTWQHHFGVGLVSTPNDFGTRGAAPTHPELLDWLAARFVESGWSMKTLHRLIVTSATYQLASRTDAKNVQADADNVLLWRFPRRRLSAEEIRDAILAVSGDLDRAPGGPHPFPEQKAWGFTQHNPFSAVYETNRRSVYLMAQRIKRHPFLALFDGADPNSSTAGRHTTTVPTQALFFMNDAFVHAKSNALALRLLAWPDDTARLERACRLLYGRGPSAEETSLAGRFLAGYQRELTEVPPERRLSLAWAAWVRVLLSSNEFVYVD